MIESIKLKNFRKHKDLHIEFSDGLNIIRAENEAGKSSLMEGVLYAMFGVKSCRNSDLATWGEATTSYKAEVVFNVAGCAYTVVRSPRGAELTYEGGRVTGQSEVSKFCEKLLGLQPNTGSKLLFANQNDMRGILEDGGAKTTQLIEHLSGLNDIEYWVELLQANYNTGRTEYYEQALESAQQRLQQSEDELRTTPDPKAEQERLRKSFSDRLEELKPEEQSLSSQYEEFKTHAERAYAQYKHLEALNMEKHRLEVELKGLNRQLEANLPDEVDEQALKQQIHRLEDRQDLWEAYCELDRYDPKIRLEGTYEELQAQLADLNRQIKELEGQAQRFNIEAAAKLKHINHDLSCPTCKRAWDDAEARAKLNAELEAEAATLKQQAQSCLDKAQELTPHAQEIQYCLSYPVPDISHTNWYAKDTGVYPPEFEWTGEIPTKSDPRELNHAKQLLLQAQAQNQLRTKTLEQQAKAIQRRDEVESRLAELGKELKDLPKSEDPQVLQTQAYETKHKWSLVQLEMSDLKRKLADLDVLTEPAFERYRRAEANYLTAKGSVKDAQEALNDIRLNNNLLKHLRTVKPLIADKVWNNVCATVSEYFGRMRGEPSVVSKGADGFEVDGNSVGSLSGSTLDILGLALRTALIKTFIFETQMVFMDEPFAACDKERQLKMLSFIQASGFKQVVIITHEDITESVATKLINL